MSDLIKREDAIKAINKALDRETLLNRLVRKIALDAIRSTPSADRPQGKWIDASSWMGFECSRCKCHSRYITPFCSQCGAKMEGADNE